MIALYLSLAIVLLAAVALWQLQRGFARPIHSWNELMGQTKAVDLSAFQNLMSNDDDLFLRQSLPGREFRRVQRLRHRAALAYLSMILHNSSVLGRAGELAASSGVDQLAGAGRRLVQLALEVRLRTLRLILRLWISMVWPTGRADLADALQRYAEMKEAFRRLGALRDPVWTASISAAL